MQNQNNMKRSLIYTTMCILCTLLFPSVLTAQDCGGVKPTWATASYKRTLDNSYLEVVVASGSDEDVVREKARKEIEKRTSFLKENDCKGCLYFKLCHGGCPLDGWNHTNSIMSKTEWCISRKFFLEKYFEPITGLIFDDTKYEN